MNARALQHRELIKPNKKGVENAQTISSAFELLLAGEENRVFIEIYFEFQLMQTNSYGMENNLYDFFHPVQSVFLSSELLKIRLCAECVRRFICAYIFLHHLVSVMPNLL